MYNILIIIIVIVIIITILYYKNPEYIAVYGNCGLKYSVLRKIGCQEVANILCEINGRCLRLIDYLKYKYIDNGIQNYKENSKLGYPLSGKEKTKLLIEEYDIDDLIEDDDETFLLGKGDKIYVCLRDITTGKLYDINFLMFIIIHELSHIITKTFQHTPEFWINNIWLMKEAELCKIYKGEDYKLKPVKYCDGFIVNNNPSFDTGFKNFLDNKQTIERFKYKDLTG